MLIQHLSKQTRILLKHFKASKQMPVVQIIGRKLFKNSVLIIFLTVKTTETDVFYSPLAAWGVRSHSSGDPKSIFPARSPTARRGLGVTLVNHFWATNSASDRGDGLAGLPGRSALERAESACCPHHRRGMGKSCRKACKLRDDWLL